jgi:hypothetical protein
MEHYVTLFDSLYLPQALALHASLQRHGGEHTLWMLCVDDASLQVLEQLKLPDTRLMRLADHETPELLNVKPGRSIGEYCWTLTPFAPRFVFDIDPSVERATYVDADLWLCRSPAPVFDEFERSGAGVLITEHSYAAEYDQTELSGRYCVQFMTFHRERGEPMRKWWEERCIEWCFFRYEEGKLGDQKYLDDWPQRFGSQVHVLKQVDSLQAPWNAIRFPYSAAVAYHFQGLRILSDGRVDAGGGYVLPKPTLRHIYRPYVDDLRHAVGQLRTVGFSVRPQAKPPGAISFLRRTIGVVLRDQWHRGRWNLFRL